MSEDSRGEMLIRREEKKFESAKARAKSYEKNMTETISAFLKDGRIKKSIARDAMEATRDTSRRDAIFEKAGQGLFNQDREIITGNEPRPWEND